MGRERCWKCKKLCNDVQLRSTDDRLCQACFDKNEADLDAIRRHDASNNVSATKVTPNQNVSTPSTTATMQGSVACSPQSSSLPKTDAVIINTNNSISTMPAVEQNQSVTLPYQKVQSAQDLGSATTSTDQQILQLRSVIHEQQVTINQLKDKLNIVLSFLGICEPTEHSTAGVSLQACDHHPEEATKPPASVENTEEIQRSPSWVSVVKKQRKPQLHRKITDF